MLGPLLGVCELPLLRVESVQGEVLVIVCDEELLGKKFEDGDLTLEIERSFYGGEAASVQKCLDALRGATIANMVGSIVEHAVEAGFVRRENVMRVQEVPYAQMVRL